MGEFEKDIRDMFENLEIQIDTNDIWPGIEKRLNKKDRKYPFWWFLFPLILVLIGSVYLISNKQIKNNQQALEINQYDQNIVSIDNEKTKTIESNKEIINNELKSIVSDNIEQIKVQNTENIKSSKIINLDISKKNKQNILPIKSLKNSSIKNKINSNENKIYSNVEILESNKNNDIKDYSNLKAKLFNQFTNIEKLKLSLNPLKFNRAIDLDIPIFNIDNKELKLPKGSWDKALDFGIGFAFVSKNMKAIDSDFVQNMSKRIHTESYLEAVTSNISLNYRHSSGFFIKTGLDYTQIDERFSDIDSIDIKKSNEGIIKTIQGENGVVASLRGQVEVVEHKTWDKIIYNYYFFIDIPLSLGYSFDINNWKVELSSGVSYNLAFLRKGQIIGVNDYPVDIAKEEDLFKNRTGFSFISDFKVLYPFRKHIFYLEPHFKYNLQKITDDNYPIEQKYFNYGIKVGTRFKF